MRRAALSTLVALTVLAGCSNILDLRDLEIDPFDGQDGATADGGVGAEAGQEGGAMVDGTTDAPLVDGTSPDGPVTDGTTPDGTSNDGTVADGTPPVDATPADSAPDSLTTCMGGETLCGSTCVNLTSDPVHCGSCAHDCLGGACTGSACQAVKIASGQSEPWDLATDGSYVYFTDNNDGTVKRCATGGCGSTPTTLASGMNRPQRLTIDATYVYFTNYGTGTTDGSIVRVKKDASLGAQTIVASEINPEGVAIDGTFVYWAYRAASGSLRVASYGGGAASVAAATQSNPTSVLLNGGALFWVTETGVVRKCTPSLGVCGAVTTLLPASSKYIFGLAVDATSVYYADLTTAGAVYSASRVDGSGAVALATAQANPLRMATDGTYLYWVNRGASNGTMADGSVMRCAVGGCSNSPTALATGQSDPHGIAVDAVAVYWANALDGSIWKIAK